MEQKFSRALLFSMVRQSRGVRSQLPRHPELGIPRKQCQPSLSANSAFSSLIPEKVPQRILPPSVRSLGFAEVSDLTFRAGRDQLAALHTYACDTLRFLPVSAILSFLAFLHSRATGQVCSLPSNRVSTHPWVPSRIPRPPLLERPPSPEQKVQNFHSCFMSLKNSS